MNILAALKNNLSLLQNDFIGIRFDFSGIGFFFLDIIIAATIFIIFYLFGEKIRKLFFKENKNYTFFVNIALGYILIGTGIAILGVFSLLRTEIIWGYLIGITLIALYPLRFLRRPEFFEWAPQNDVVKWGVLLFVLIAFLRLMTPEIGEDGYHTDLPRLYLSSHTMMHEARDPLRVIPYPQLAEMTYMIPIFLSDKEATRFIHFGFYLVTILLLFSIAKKKESSFAKFAPLLFVTSPLVIRYSWLSFIDFFMIFCFLLSVLLLEKKSKKQLLLSGIILGGAISTKLWLLIYLPALLAYIVYLYKQEKLREVGKKLLLFTLAALAVGMIWYIRDFMITGSPIYPVFAKPEYLEANAAPASSYRSFGFNWKMFLPSNLFMLSPLFFLGFFFFIISLRKSILTVRKSSLVVFALILTVEQLMVSVYLGRHLLAWNTIVILVISAGVVFVMKQKMFKVIFVSMYCLLFFYYFINTLLTLPYGFGWADQNKYLTRVLGRDNANYYDFDHLFNKWISDRDVVATYGIVSYYYADFSYKDVNYIFSKNGRSFDLLKKRGATKLLVKGGEIDWFCKMLSLTQCDKNKVKLLATWPDATRKYNLYEIK